jgi:Tat protein secretion system quality control protein TatD with DNase activity
LEGEKMNFNRILNFIAENNIEPEQVFNLVEKVKRTDLSNENNIREIIHEVSKLTNKPVSKSKEDEIIKKVVENIDIQYLLSETDSPYLTPHPYRGQENGPKYIPLIVEQIASLKNIDINSVEKTLLKNTKKLFRLE